MNNLKKAIKLGILITLAPCLLICALVLIPYHGISYAGTRQCVITLDKPESSMTIKSGSVYDVCAKSDETITLIVSNPALTMDGLVINKIDTFPKVFFVSAYKEKFHGNIIVYTKKNDGNAAHSYNINVESKI